MSLNPSSQPVISHAFQRLSAELENVSEADRAAYLARVCMILAHELNNPPLFDQVLARAKGSE